MSKETKLAKSAPPLKYIQPNLEVLSDALEPFLDSVTSFVNWRPQWSDTKNKWNKYPIQPVDKPNKHMNFVDAIKNGLPLGIVTNDRHTIVALDIDGVDPSKHQDLKDFQEAYPTYEEASPSGKPHRRRRLYSLLNTEAKSLLTKRKTQKFSDDSEISLYSSGNSFVTLTGEEINNHPINLISADDITSTWPIFKKKENIHSLPPITTGGLSPVTRATLTKPGTWVKQVPLRRDDPMVMRFCEKQGLSYYDYWLMGVMVLHYTHPDIEAFTHASNWSQKAEDEYDQEELQSKWSTLSKEKGYEALTEKTYQWIFDCFNIPWPVRGTKGAPVHGEISNFQAFLGHYDLKLEVDAITKTVFLNGPDSSLYPAYYENKKESHMIHSADVSRLSARMIDITRSHKFRPSYGDIKKHIETLAKLLLPHHHRSRFAQEVTDCLYDPEVDGDYITIVSRDILTRNSRVPPTQEFQDILFRKWMLSLGRVLWPDEMPKKYRGQTAEGMLILSGPKGGIGKSSFGRKLLPEEWNHLYAECNPKLTGQSQDKDYKMTVCSRLIVDYDEAERVINNNSEADIKSEITAAIDLLRVPYGDSVETYPRMYSSMASTNETTLNIARRGARRYWWLNIIAIDLAALDEMDMYKLWAQVRYELINAPTTDNAAPWLLTNEERKYLENYLAPHRNENRWELELNELYDFSPEGYKAKQAIVDEENFELNSNNPLIRYVTSGLKDVAMALGDSNLTHPGLKRAIASLVKVHAPAKVYVKQTLLESGVIKWRGQTRYYLPVPRS